MAFLLSLLSWTWMPLLTARWDLEPLLSLSRGTALRPTLGFILQTKKEIDSLSRAPMYRELLRLGYLGDWRERERDRCEKSPESGGRRGRELQSVYISYNLLCQICKVLLHIKTNCYGTLHPSGRRNIIKENINK